MGNGKIWPSADAKTPEPIVTKFETRDYVADIFFQKIWAQSVKGFLSPYKAYPKYRAYTQNFPMLTAPFFSVLPNVYRRARWTDFHGH